MKNLKLKSSLLIGLFMVSIISLIYIGNGDNSSPQRINYPNSAITYPENPTIPIQAVTDGVINSSNRKILYWVQVSDLHINTQKELERLDKFDQLCNYINSTIQPAFVISTGDNVDATEAEHYPIFYQNETEYIFYNDTLEKYNFGRDFWFSVVGNHDTYNTGLNRSWWLNYIRNETQYAADIQTSFGNYRFIMTDTTHEFGMEELTGVFGEMKTDKLNHIEKLSTLNNDALNQTVFAGHHPLNEILGERTDSGKDLRQIIDESNAPFSLCGHLHGVDLYANHQDFAEIQCPSFKSKYMFRICAFDDDLFSFSDIKLEDALWKPAVVITSPIDGRFYTDKMPLERMENHNEIRALVFNTSDITSAYAEIDGVVIGNLTYQDNNLMAVPWINASLYTGNEHNLKVYVSCGVNTTETELYFNFNQISIAIPITPSLIVTVSMIGVLSFLIILFMIISFGRIIIPKLYYRMNYSALKDLTVEDIIQKDNNYFNKHFLKKWINVGKMPISISLPLILLPLYILFGPIVIGLFSNETIGIIWLFRITILESYAISLWSPIMAGIFMIVSVLISKYTIEGYRKKIRVRYRISMIFSILLMFVILLISWLFWGNISVFINPSYYIFIGVQISMIIQVERNQAQRRKKRKIIEVENNKIN